MNGVEKTERGTIMGLLDSLLRAGVRAATGKVVDKAVDAVFDSIKGESNSGNSATTITYSAEDNRSFDEKLNAVLKNIGDFEIRKNISPDELEQEAGTQIYTRGGSYKKPENITYAIYKDGQRELYINLWDDYQVYKRRANRQIVRYCNSKRIRILDFFAYMPNEAGYMEERIRERLAR